MLVISKMYMFIKSGTAIALFLLVVVILMLVVVSSDINVSSSGYTLNKVY
jgi:hypothetical protein